VVIEQGEMASSSKRVDLGWIQGKSCAVLEEGMGKLVGHLPHAEQD